MKSNCCLLLVFAVLSLFLAPESASAQYYRSRGTYCSRSSVRVGAGVHVSFGGSYYNRSYCQPIYRPSYCQPVRVYTPRVYCPPTYRSVYSRAPAVYQQVVYRQAPRVYLAAPLPQLDSGKRAARERFDADRRAAEYKQLNKQLSDRYLSPRQAEEIRTTTEARIKAAARDNSPRYGN